VRIAVFGKDAFRSGGSDHGRREGRISRFRRCASPWWAIVLLVVGVRTLNGWSWPRTFASLAVAGVVFVLIALLFIIGCWRVELVYETHSTSVDKRERDRDAAGSTARLSSSAAARRRSSAQRRGTSRPVYASDLGRAVETAAIAFPRARASLFTTTRGFASATTAS
jgi:membrane protein implicated in regulation of membrane protease activity